MKQFILINACLTLFIVFTNFDLKQKKYLPVYITMGDTSAFHSEIALNITGVLIANKIKVISKQEAEAYIKSEGSVLAEGYLKSGGDITDFDKYKQYFSLNMRPVANSIYITINISQDGIINDTIKWNNHTVPMDFLNPPKNKWNFVFLNRKNAGTILQMSQSIADSIIASNVLIKD